MMDRHWSFISNQMNHPNSNWVDWQFLRAIKSRSSMCHSQWNGASPLTRFSAVSSPNLFSYHLGKPSNELVNGDHQLSSYSVVSTRKTNVECKIHTMNNIHWRCDRNHPFSRFHSMVMVSITANDGKTFGIRKYQIDTINLSSGSTFQIETMSALSNIWLNKKLAFPNTSRRFISQILVPRSASAKNKL